MKQIYQTLRGSRFIMLYAYVVATVRQTVALFQVASYWANSGFSDLP
jgi:hypothetical protein